MTPTAFSMMLALVLAATVVIVPSFAPYNQVLLLPAVFVIVAYWSSLWSRDRLTRVISVIAGSGGFLAMAGLMRTIVCILILTTRRRYNGAWTAPLRNSLLLPVVVLGLLELCVKGRLGGPPVARADAGWFFCNDD